MKKLLFYLILTVVNLILIILDILRPFLGLVRILAYCNLLGLAFCYFIYDKLPSAFIISTILSFTIVYGYQSLIDFFIGIKTGMLDTVNYKEP